MPRFPFKRSVGQDLRDLFGHDRLKDQERGLGYSSISPGEGSAEVRDAAGNTLAHFGHAAGKAGFLVPDGAGWQTVQEAAASAVSAATGPIETRLDAHGTRLGFVEADITDLENNKVGFSTYNVLAGRVGAAENDITGIKNGTIPLQSPTLISPNLDGLTSGGQTAEWVPLLVNKNTGSLRAYGDGPVG